VRQINSHPNADWGSTLTQSRTRRAIRRTD
jgi:hypothetical protein